MQVIESTNQEPQNNIPAPTWSKGIQFHHKFPASEATEYASAMKAILDTKTGQHILDKFASNADLPKGAPKDGKSVRFGKLTVAIIDNTTEAVYDPTRHLLALPPHYLATPQIVVKVDPTSNKKSLVPLVPEEKLVAALQLALGAQEVAIKNIGHPDIFCSLREQAEAQRDYMREVNSKKSQKSPERIMAADATERLRNQLISQNLNLDKSWTLDRNSTNTIAAVAGYLLVDNGCTTASVEDIVRKVRKTFSDNNVQTTDFSNAEIRNIVVDVRNDMQNHAIRGIKRQ